MIEKKSVKILFNLCYLCAKNKQLIIKNLQTFKSIKMSKNN
jgi:hypothetical protein